ncbi:hypothetical protein BDK51DRAFT_44076 [Blyttiomyces helicus]|uniref:F-box domain-containing protein n=1 Tax=Blyttiomyces helicus TaxID=388810 RepID=A0A4P9VV74_9FUNG|nr:hypothetical protein BDK51DRAFT_44076 [Blyttiomyces helicus]|eukprot:RKO83531.1 hypothetical protein BDK51DRAFT_44076 [Blyttiomyces helicus]
MEWRGLRLGTLRFQADALPNLEVVVLYRACSANFFASLAHLRPPLRRLVVSDCLHYLADAITAFLRACPSTNHLELVDIGDHYLDTGFPTPLQDHTPLTVLRFGPGNPSSTCVEPDDTGPYYEVLKRVLRARGSNLKLLDIDESLPIDDDLLACIGEIAPLLEVLIMEGYLMKHFPTSAIRVPLAKITFIADLKRAGPNLRHVYPNVVTRCDPSALADAIAASSGVLYHRPASR